MSDGDWAPGGWGGFGPPQQSRNGYREEPLKWEQLDKIKPRPLVFIQKPFLQAASFHLLVGIKNTGKGTWLSHWAAKMTRGELGERRNVIWIAIGEDSYGMDVRPRIEAAGGDLSRVTCLTQGRLTLPEGTEALRKAANRLKNVGLIVLDPLGGSLSGDKDTNSDKDVRPALASVNELADRSGAMVIGVRHLSIKNDKRQGGALAAVLGSTDWINIPRAVLALVHDDIDGATRHLFLLTGNRVRHDTPGLMFRIEGVKPEGWDEEVTVAREIGQSGKDPDELLVIKRKRRITKTDASRTLIGELLAAQDGYRMESETLDAAIADKTGSSVRTIQRARMEMKEAGLVKAIPDKDEHGTVLRWFVALTTAGATQFVTHNVEQGDGEPDLAFWPESHKTVPESHLFWRSGDLQGFSENGDPDRQLYNPDRQTAGSPDGGLDGGVEQSPDIVTLSDLTGDATTGNGMTPYEWVEQGGFMLADDALEQQLVDQFGVGDEDVGALLGLAESLRG